jgi:hypothetical protein
MTSTWPPASPGVYDPIMRPDGPGQTVPDGARDLPESQEKR